MAWMKTYSTNSRIIPTTTPNMEQEVKFKVKESCLMPEEVLHNNFS